MKYYHEQRYTNLNKSVPNLACKIYTENVVATMNDKKRKTLSEISEQQIAILQETRLNVTIVSETDYFGEEKTKSRMKDLWARIEEFL